MFHRISWAELWPFLLPVVLPLAIWQPTLVLGIFFLALLGWVAMLVREHFVLSTRESLNAACFWAPLVSPVYLWLIHFFLVYLVNWLILFPSPVELVLWYSGFFIALGVRMANPSPRSKAAANMALRGYGVAFLLLGGFYIILALAWTHG